MEEHYTLFVWQDADGADWARCFLDGGEVRVNSRTGVIGALGRELMARGQPDRPWRAYSDPIPPPRQGAPLAHQRQIIPGRASAAQIGADPGETLVLDAPVAEEFDEAEIEAARMELDAAPVLRLRMSGRSIHEAARWTYTEGERGIVRQRWGAYIRSMDDAPCCVRCGECKYVFKTVCVECGCAVGR